jgi:hypothetical protein
MDKRSRGNMEIIRSYWLPISAILIIVAMTLAATATDRQSSATDFDPDYPIGTPPILGGTGYVTETPTGWHNAQDWSEYNTDYSGYHPGEDWNYGYGTDDVGEPVYAISAGTVFDIRDALFNDKSGYGSGIAIEHTLPSGEKIYSVCEHIDITSGLSIGDPVWQGDRIGSIADTSKLSPHLHFEIRTKQMDTADWYPNDNGFGYYASEEKLHIDGFTVDPSDFIDSHRSVAKSEDAGNASQVTLTLYVHDGSASGPIIPGALVTGQDASGNSFQQTTDSSGYVTIEGDPGTWSFSASADGYATGSWDQEITEDDTRDAFLQKVQAPSQAETKESAPVTLTLYVHEGRADGPKLSGAEVTGQDSAGNSFSQITDENGFVVITGSPGSWQFTATKQGYDVNSWPQEITETGTKHAYLFAEKMPTIPSTENDVQSTTQNVSSGSEASADSEVGDLINALKDSDAGVRKEAAESLGKLADARAVDPLIEALRYDENGEVREMAAWALGQIDDARTVDPLSYTSVKDADGYVRGEAYNALQKSTIGGNKVDARSVDPIIGALKDEDQGVRYRAAEALGQLKNATSVDSLIEALNDENSDVRQKAAWALGEIGDARAVDPLNYASVKDADGYVREEAKKALEKLGVQPE